MIGSTISHYKILEKLGEGGMGVVYKGYDTRLDRPVALKFLMPQMLGSEAEKTRFVHEAQAAAALDHPNICTVYEIDEAEGQTFIAMAYIEGQSLKEKIECGPLKLDEALDIAIQVAQGLQAAHEKGIVHRDIKSANVMVTKTGQAKIMDFGLAKLAGRTKVTKTGITVGTIAYMSPEQGRGEEVDHRTDIWSLGVVLYEMITGWLPFPGDYEQAIVYRIVNEEPEPIPSVQAKIPMGLERIVEKALAKSAEKRYKCAGEIAAELQSLREEIRSGVAKQRLIRFRIPRKKRAYAFGAIAILLAAIVAASLFFFTGTSAKMDSIAVLPLANLSGDPDQDYFADGMTEELITNLAQISALKVISRTSIMRYKGTKKPLPQIAKELNVDAVVEGSVLREGGQVRITAQLIQAATDEHLWAESYRRDLRSVLALQGEIASAIAEKVRAVLTPTERVRMAGARPVNPEAYEAYLKGKFYINKMTQDGFEKGLAHLNQAIKIDSTNPQSYAALALAYSIIGHERHPDAFALATATTRKAEELGGNLPAEMYVASGMKKLYSDWDYAGAAKDLRRAMELNPSIGEAHRDYSWYLFLIGHRDEALAEMKRAQDVEPLTPLFASDRGWQYWWMGRYDEALEEARKGLELDSNFAYGLYVLGGIYAEKGMYAEAIAAHQKAGAVDPDWRWGLARTYAQAGRKDEARRILAKSLQEKPKPTGAWAGWFLAGTYVALGEKDEAFHWLEAAYKERHSFMPWLLEEPAFAPLRDDPRFQDLVRRMNLPTNENR
ncbi:MAG: tetratricopeptide repeat protein [Calditrichaeota bacterium]|nr:tetratricopeptide repeat protein [Calditrichota bacterium]